MVLLKLLLILVNWKGFKIKKRSKFDRFFFMRENVF